MKVRLGQNQPVEEHPRSMKVTLVDDKGLDTSIKAKELLTDRFILNLKIRIVIFTNSRMVLRSIHRCLMLLVCCQLLHKNCQQFDYKI